MTKTHLFNNDVTLALLVQQTVQKFKGISGNICPSQLPRNVRPLMTPAYEAPTEVLCPLLGSSTKVLGAFLYLHLQMKA